jgi:hypothetical protein
MARYDDINAKVVLYATVLSCILLFAIIQAGQAMTFYWSYTYEDRRLDNSEYETSEEAIREQRASLGGYKWVNEPPAEEGQEPVKRLNIPLDRAKEAVLQDLQSSTAGA